METLIKKSVMINQMLLNEVYQPSSGLIINLKRQLMKLPLDAIRNLKTIQSFRETTVKNYWRPH